MADNKIDGKKLLEALESLTTETKTLTGKIKDADIFTVAQTMLDGYKELCGHTFNHNTKFKFGDGSTRTVASDEEEAVSQAYITYTKATEALSTTAISKSGEVDRSPWKPAVSAIIQRFEGTAGLFSYWVSHSFPSDYQKLKNSLEEATKAYPSGGGTF